MRYKHDNTLVLSHYYCSPEVQQLADHVGDSLDLALKAVEENPKRIIFCGVKFMSESCKIMLPDTEVILPDHRSTCSLVEQTDIRALKLWRNCHSGHVHVAYINSSAEHKALSDWIVTSRNVVDIIQHLHNEGKQVMFSPDRNMGLYLRHEFGFKMPTWHAVCTVHDNIKEEQLDDAMRGWTDYPKYLIAHPESILPILKRADYVGSTHGMLNWIKEFPYRGGTIFVATEGNLLHNMRKIRPELDIRCAPSYDGCKCSICKYMGYNTVDLVKSAVQFGTGFKIDYLSEETIIKARVPIERMLNFSTEKFDSEVVG